MPKGNEGLNTSYGGTKGSTIKSGDMPKPTTNRPLSANETNTGSQPKPVNNEGNRNARK